jgi:hypothetical protein
MAAVMAAMVHAVTTLHVTLMRYVCRLTAPAVAAVAAAASKKFIQIIFDLDIFYCIIILKEAHERHR